MAGWRVQWWSSKSIVCTNMGNDGHKNNCNSCDSWRMYAFQDGAEDQSAGDDAGRYTTKAGTVYGGHSPCRPGNNLVKCGEWTKPTASPTEAPSTRAPTRIPRKSTSTKMVLQYQLFLKESYSRRYRLRASVVTGGMLRDSRS